MDSTEEERRRIFKIISGENTLSWSISETKTEFLLSPSKIYLKNIESSHVYVRRAGSYSRETLGKFLNERVSFVES